MQGRGADLLLPGTVRLPQAVLLLVHHRKLSSTFAKERTCSTRLS